MFLELLKEKSFQNTIIIMINQFASVLFAFLFWKIASVFYVESEIGIASSLISIMLWISIFSRFGVDDSVKRFMPEMTDTAQNNFFISITNFILVTSVLFGILLIFLILILSSAIKISFLTIITLIFLVVSFSINPIQDSTLLNKEGTIYILLRSLINGLLRIFLIFFLISFSTFGIILSSTIPLFLSSVLTFLFMIKKYQLSYSLRINFIEIKQITLYSFGIFLSSLIYYIPVAFFPFLIIEFDSPQAGGYFTIAWQLSKILYLVLTAINFVFVVEGSKSTLDINKTIKKSSIIGLIILIPSIFSFLIIGPFLLLFFGSVYYINGLFSFYLLTLTMIPTFIILIYQIYCQIKKFILNLIIINTFIAFTSLSISLLLIGRYGMNIICFSWLFSHSIVALFIIILLIIKILSKN